HDRPPRRLVTDQVRRVRQTLQVVLVEDHRGVHLLCVVVVRGGCSWGLVGMFPRRWQACPDRPSKRTDNTTPGGTERQTTMRSARSTANIPPVRLTTSTKPW